MIKVHMLFKWRSDLRAGLLAKSESRSAHLLSVVVQCSPVRPMLPSATVPARHIEIVIADPIGRVSTGTNAALLQLVLHSLRT